MPKRRKTKRGIQFGIQGKIIVAVLMMNIVIGSVLTLFELNALQEQSIYAGAQSALSIVSIASKSVNATTLEKVLTDGQTSSSYDITYNYMSVIKESTDIVRIYTIGKDEANNYCYLVDIYGDDTEGEYTGKGADAFVTLSAMTAMNNKMAFAYESIKESNGRQVIIGVAPVVNTAGVVTGAIFVECDASNVIETMQKTSTDVIVIAIVIIVICSAFMLLLTRSIVGGLKKVNKKVNDIVETDGDLTQKIELRANDETKEIAENINKLLEYIRNVIVDIAQCSKELAQSAEKTSGNAMESNDAIENISKHLEHINHEIEDISNSIVDMENTFVNIDKVIGTLTEKVKEGDQISAEIDLKAEKIVVKAQEQTEEVKKQSQAMELKLKERLEQAKEVSKIQELTDKILEITDETDLLALNANIEAARAGEAGRGFTIVANQISKLARDSAESAQHIQEISQVILDIVGSLAQESEEMLAFLNEKTIGGFGQLVEIGSQYSDDAKYFAGTMGICREQASQITNEMESAIGSIDVLNNSMKNTMQGVESITTSVEHLSQQLKENKVETDHTHDISEKLDQEVQKFII